jgi:hypothetical protein
VSAPWLDIGRFDAARLAQAWRSAEPFPFVVLDGLVGEARRELLVEAFADEPAAVIRDEIFEMTASAVRVEHATFRAFHAALESAEVLALVGQITGKAVRRADLRAFGYEPGQYLLPHTDHQKEIGRAVAYAFYVDVSGDLEGGELVLYACDFAGPEIVATRQAQSIAPRSDRLVLFDVSDASLHEVREVTRGLRLSLAGWFYP